MDEAEWQAVLRSKTKIPSELARIKVSRYGFHQLNKQSPSLGSRIAAKHSVSESRRRRRANAALDLTNISVAESEALYLLGLYSDINEIHTINSLDELNRIDRVISALQTFDRVAKSNLYDGLIQALKNIKSKFHFKKYSSLGGKRKTRKHKRNTRKS